MLDVSAWLIRWISVFQHKSRHSGQNADQQRQYDDKRLFLYMTLAPHQKHHEGILKAFCYGCEKQFHFFPFYLVSETLAPYDCA